MEEVIEMFHASRPQAYTALCFFLFLQVFSICFEANNEKWKKNRIFLSAFVCFPQNLEMLYGHVSVFL